MKWDLYELGTEGRHLQHAWRTNIPSAPGQRGNSRKGIGTVQKLLTGLMIWQGEREREEKEEKKEKRKKEKEKKRKREREMASFPILIHLTL